MSGSLVTAITTTTPPSTNRVRSYWVWYDRLDWISPCCFSSSSSFRSLSSFPGFYLSLAKADLLYESSDGHINLTAELLPMRHTDGPVLPMYVEPMDTMEVFFVKLAHLTITGGLQWLLDVYGDIAVRDSLDWKRNYLFRRDRNNCQTLTSAQARPMLHRPLLLSFHLMH